MDTLVASLVDINVSPIFDPLRVKETPDQAIYQAYEETGTDLAQVRHCCRQLSYLVFPCISAMHAGVSRVKHTQRKALSRLCKEHVLVLSVPLIVPGCMALIQGSRCT